MLYVVPVHCMHGALYINVDVDVHVCTCREQNTLLGVISLCLSSHTVASYSLHFNDKQVSPTWLEPY